MKHRIIISLSSIALMVGLGVGLLLIPLIARAASSSVTHTTTADFTNSCSVLTEEIPAPLFLSTQASADSVLLTTTNFTDDFSSGNLNASLWEFGSWDEIISNTPLVSSGVLSVPTVTWVRSVETFSYGVLEFRAEFGPGNNQHIGFGSNNFEGNRYFIFSTDSTTDTLFARVNNNGLEQKVNLGALPTGLHLYRIEWRPVIGDADTDHISFYVDGSLVAEFDVGSNSNTGNAQEFYIYLSNDDSSADLRVDLVGLRSGFYPGGFYTSCALDAGLDAGAPNGWQKISWDATLAAQTGLVVETRVSNDGSTWSNWQTVTGGLLTRIGRYAQYRLNLASSNVLTTPLVNSVVLTYNTIPTLTISNIITVTEDNAGTVNAVFTVTLSSPVSQTVMVDYVTADGTATSPTDYTGLTTNTLTFAPGVTTQNITVTVQGDVADEDSETFFVNLSNPINATVSDNQGQGLINDDDDPPTLTINDVSVTEGNSGTTNAVFTVSLSVASGKTVTVNYYTTTDGTATSPTDYTGLTTNTLTFAPGVTTQNITVTVQGDVADEDSETFFVNLSNPTNATVSDNQGQGLINDDDNPPNITINNVSVLEGSSGVTNAIFTVSLSPQSGKTVTVNYATADGTATTADNDYIAATGTLTFTPGVITQTITVAVNGDGAIEPNENFFVNLSGPTNANITDPQGEGIILSDDLPGVAVNQLDGSTNVAEGGATDTYQVNLQNQPPANVFIVITTDGQTTVSSTLLTFTPAIWNVPQTVTVTAVDDAIIEASPHPSTITHAIRADSDSSYLSVSVPDITVNVTDNDGKTFLPLIIK